LGFTPIPAQELVAQGFARAQAFLDLRKLGHRSEKQRILRMASHIIMDVTGDTRHEFDATDALAVSLAEERFRQLTRQGFRAVELVDGGGGRLLDEFTPLVEKTLFIPQLRGG
jgi:hypothetical protein